MMLVEVNVMCFVVENILILVFKVYCSFEYGERVYILMERVLGCIFLEDWSEWLEEFRICIFDQL